MAAKGAKRSPRPRDRMSPVAKTGGGRKSPRFEKYGRLIQRFYEPLILLDALGQTRAPHDKDPDEPSTLQERRRRLLCNLSYLCDFAKGGDTTAAIGLEETPNAYVFWLASNTTGSDNKVITFLRDALAEVKKVVQGQTATPDEFIERCIKFAKNRVLKEHTRLRKTIEECREYLDLDDDAEDIALWRWLQQFYDDTLDCVPMCRGAYEQRKAPKMKYLKTKIDSTRRAEGLEDIVDAFQQVRHYIGRLSHHVRAPLQVIEDASCLSRLLEVYHVVRIRPMPNIERPEPDGQTTLEAILGRMLPESCNPTVRGEYEECLRYMNQKFGLQERILTQYSKASFKPKVHAEVQVLEHFYQNELRFAHDDPYIGCSKPACFCCRLYFRNHPMSCVEPDTHNNIWLNWGPPALADRGEDKWFSHQRDILNKMVGTIRKQVLDQLKSKADPLRRHADSRTGITQSIASEPLNRHSLAVIEESFEGLSIAGDYTDPSTSDTEVNRTSSPAYSNLSSTRVAGSSSSQQSDASSDDDDSDNEGGAFLS